MSSDNVGYRTKQMTFGGHKFNIEQVSESYYIAVPEDPLWMMKVLHEICERDAAERAAKIAKK